MCHCVRSLTEWHFVSLQDLTVMHKAVINAHVQVVKCIPVLSCLLRQSFLKIRSGEAKNTVVTQSMELTSSTAVIYLLRGPGRLLEGFWSCLPSKAHDNAMSCRERWQCEEQWHSSCSRRTDEMTSKQQRLRQVTVNFHQTFLYLCCL